MEDMNGNKSRYIKITRSSSMMIGLRNITNKAVMFKVHSNPRAGPNHPLSGLLLPGEELAESLFSHIKIFSKRLENAFENPYYAILAFSSIKSIILPVYKNATTKLIHEFS